MLQTAITSLISLITAILPLVTGSQNSTTVTAIENIIQALTNLLPTIVEWSETEYQVVKNILGSLQNSGVLTQDQITATQTLGAQVDAEWASISAQIDPDNPANAGTPAGPDT